jgi:PIN domain nuclease of toxin-antitoxin system
VSFLLDTCVVLWAAREPARLPRCVRDLLLDPKHEIMISVASAWEIAVKPELGIGDPAGWLRTAAEKLHSSLLPVRLDHIAVLQTLPYLHKDPFDRILIAQALSAKAELVTNDEAIGRYDAIPRLWE